MAINWGRALMQGTSGAVSGRRDLAIAERLKKEAEARDLAMRQTLAGEAGVRQTTLQELSGVQALDREKYRVDAGIEEEKRRRSQGQIDTASELGIYDQARTPAERMLAISQEQARRRTELEAQEKAESKALVGSRNRSNVRQPREEKAPTVEFRNAGDSLLALTKNPDGSWASEVVDVPGGGKPKENAQVFKDYQRAISDEVDLLYKDYKLRLDNGLMEPEDFPTNAEIVKAATETVKERMDLVAGQRTAVLSPGVSPGGTGGLGITEAEALAMWENTGN